VHPPAPKTCWIIGRRNGVGLEQDAALVARALTDSGWLVQSHAPRDLSPLLNPLRRPDAIIHLERAFPLWTLKKATHFLIPNQERFPTRHLTRLKRIHHILCKSQHAREIFTRHHPSVHFIGFTSPDRLLPDAQPPPPHTFFHLAGKSTLKNTDVLLELWAKHPHWPTLTLVQHPDNAPAAVPKNVHLISRYLADAELRTLQNTHAIHLCPSLSEGWGHYIVEAMSCRAAVLTTDAPPMNELIAPDRGILVPTHRSEPRHLGQNFWVDPAALESSIHHLLTLPPTEITRLGNAARTWFLQNQTRFSQTLPTLISSKTP
jgi:glycosyltransferase involved in cell wall biosynthesis